MDRTSLVLLGALALSSCDGPQGAAAERFVRLEPQPIAGADPELPEAEVQRLSVHEGAGTWRITGPRWDVRSDSAGGRVLWIEEGAQVRIPGPFDPAKLQAVVLLGVLHGEHHLNVQVPGAGPAQVGNYTGTGEGPPQALYFGFEHSRSRTDPVDEVIVAVRGPGFALHALELVEVPLENSLPPPSQPGLIDVQGLARRGSAILAGAPLEAQLDVRAGDVLHFALGRPAARAAGTPARVRLTLECGGETEERSYELQAEPDGSVPWMDVHEPLDRFAGDALHLRFELEAASDTPPVAGLAEVFVTAQGEGGTCVLLITSDTHRGDHLGVYELDAGPRTPALDALAARGVLFEDCFATSSFTSPSHVALMTGLSPRDTGVVKNSGTFMKEEARTLAEAYRASGFATYAVVTFQHLGPEGTGLGQGFDRMAWCPTNDWDAATPVAILESWLPAAEGRPLFAWLHLADAHYPYAPPEGFDRLYYPADQDPFDPSWPRPALPDHTLPKDLSELRDLDFPRAQYRAEVSYLDSELGRLLEHPRLRGALVAFTSDHGEVMGDHGSWFAHLEIWPDTLHVPLILAGPGVESGRMVSGPVVQTDVARTLLDLAGLQAAEFPGRNLLAAPDEASRAREPRFALGPYAASAAITWEGWYLLMALRERPPSEALQLDRHEVLLFDRTRDPGCTQDVAADQPETTARLRAALVRWLSQPQGEGLSEQVTQDAETLAQLAALGYTGETWAVEGRAWIDPDCDCARCRAYR